VRPIVTRLARKQVRQTYHLHGLDRHSLQEQRGFAQRDLQALAVAVENSSDLDAGSPRYFDFTLAGFLAGVYDQQPPTWVNELADQYPRLKEYTEQVQRSVGVWGRVV
jgi:hypothetical protein